MLELIMLIIFQSLSSVCVSQFVLFVSDLIFRANYILYLIFRATTICSANLQSPSLLTSLLLMRTHIHSFNEDEGTLEYARILVMVSLACAADSLDVWC